MALANRYVVLYFTNGPVPSTEQLMDARKYGPHVMFRNTIFIREGDGCEPATAVAGEVPAQYARRYPAAVTYAEWLDGKLPTPEPEPTAGELALGVDTRSLASRILDPDTSRPKRGQRGAPTPGADPLPGMTGTESLPPPPPPPMASSRGSTTGAVELPPPPPPPPA